MPDFAKEPPQAEDITDYDRRHFVTYLRLLDAKAETADWREAVKIIFGIDPTHEPDRAKHVHDSHLARAEWMTQAGYRHLLEKGE